MEMTRKICILDEAPPLIRSEISLHAILRWVYLLVYQEPNEAPGNQPNHHWQRHGCRRCGERYPGDKYHGLEALTQHSDERQDEHGVLLCPTLKGVAFSLGRHGPVLEAPG